jgi:hypothetical protein
MKQSLMFDVEESDNTKYSAKIEAPIYEPKNQQPYLLTLCDDSKTNQLIREIENSGLPEAEKTFLRIAAYRHSVFHYERISDYYAHASSEMQKLMEKSALVIVDFDDAIQNGFVRLCEDVKTQFLEEYTNENDS